MLAANYAYASGKLKTLEPTILDNTDIERMVDAPDFKSAFKVLNDTDYADNLLEIADLDYRDALRDDFDQLYRLLKNIIPDKNVFAFLYSERDFLIIRYLIKIKYLNQLEKLDDLSIQNSINNIESLKAYILEKKDNGLDPEIKKIIDLAEQEAKQNPQPAEIDTNITKHYFKFQIRLAEKIKNKFISKLLKIQIDQANLLTYLRSKRLNLTKEMLINRLFDGGNIKLAELIGFYEEDLKTIKSLVNKYYNQAVVKNFDDYLDKDSLFLFEKALEDFQTNYCRQAKMIAYGPEVVVAYYLAKTTAVKNIRLIMTGKLNQIPNEEIKKTLRATY